MCVLVVDDNILDRRYLKYLIENNLGIETFTAKDGFDALKKLKQKTFDLLVTDLLMPKMEGIELIEKVHTLFPAIQIVAVSGGNPYFLYVAKKLGVSHVYTKPIDTYKFLKEIQQMLPTGTQRLVV
jgi:YesN/AraC family two-component response regulator